MFARDHKASHTSPRRWVNPKLEPSQPRTTLRPTQTENSAATHRLLYSSLTTCLDHGPFPCVCIPLSCRVPCMSKQALSNLLAAESSLIPFLSYALHSIRTTPPRIIASPATRELVIPFFPLLCTRRSDPYPQEIATGAARS